MRRKLIAGATALAAAGLVTGVAVASGGSSSAGPSRLDDGKDLLPQATISEHQAVDAARASGAGAIGEVDLEHYQGRLVFNVDVGDRDVKVDAGSGDVLGSSTDDWAAEALRGSDLETVQARGFGFQVELTHRAGAQRAGLRLAEIPITFGARHGGRSKMSAGIGLEALCQIPAWRRRA